jgi:hypothetical protein
VGVALDRLHDLVGIIDDNIAPPMRVGPAHADQHLGQGRRYWSCRLDATVQADDLNVFI